MRRTRNAGAVEPLEARVLFCLDHVAAATSVILLAAPTPASATVPLTTRAAIAGGAGSVAVADNGLPLLHSLPGAPAALYLDFDGAASISPYDTDGDATTFGAVEQAELSEAWRQLASYFSMFNLDVTTELPATGPYSYSIVGNSIGLGIFSGYFPTTTPVSFNPSADARSRQSAMAHEAGHAFGLEHQSDYNRAGAKVNEYSSGPDRLHGPIMGVDFAGDVHKWVIGHPSSSPLNLQDDVAVIAGRIAAYSGGDGVRPDDVPGSFAEARPLAAGADVWNASGIVERLDDADAYRFEAPGGPLRIDLVPPAPSMLDGVLEVYTEDGTLIAAADGATNDQHLLFPSLPAGRYYAVVKGHGDYADLGPYNLTVSRASDLPGPAPQYNSLAAPAGLILGAGSGTGIDAIWDPVDGATGYVIERSGDGVAWTQVGATAADVASWGDGDLAGGHRYFYRVSATDADGRSVPSTAASLVNRLSAPADLSVTTWGKQFILNWRDTSGEGGYRIDRQAVGADGAGGPWGLAARVGRNVPSAADANISYGGRYRYRVVATGPSGESAPADVTCVLLPSSVQGLRIAERSATAVKLQWDAIVGATFTVQRSTDAANFNPVGTTTAATFTDASVVPVTRYWYRVVAVTDEGETVRSSSVHVAVPAAEPLPDGWQGLDIGGAAGGASGTFAAGCFSYTADPASLSVIGGGAGFQSPDRLNGDSLRLVHFLRGGNFTITARVVFQGQVPAGASAGLMFRETPAATSRFFYAGVSPQFGLGTEARYDSENLPEATVRSPTATGSWWVRLVRQGSVITASGSSNFDTWTTWETYHTEWVGPALLGFAVMSGSDGTLASVKFDHVAASFNTAPAILQPPTARPVAGDSSRFDLSVFAVDYSGAGGLTYTWSVDSAPVGARPPAFSDNGSTSASAVTATLFAAGRYVIRIIVTDAQRRTAASSVAIDLRAEATTLSVSPTGLIVPAGSRRQFYASVFDQFGQRLEAPVGWAGYYGSVSPGGLYLAPPFGSWDSVTAFVGNLSVSADVYVYNNADGPSLLSAASRKVHGRSGPVELPVTIFGRARTVEPRRGGPTTLRLTFSTDVFAADGVLDENDFDLVGAAFRSASVSGAVLTLGLGDVEDGSVVTVGFARLADRDGRAVQGSGQVQVEARYGDVDGSGVVNAADALLLRRATALRTAAPNLLLDLDLSGTVSAADLALLRRRLTAVSLLGALAVPLHEGTASAAGQWP